METSRATRGRGTGERWFTIVLVVAVVVMAVELVLLVRQNRGLRATVVRMSTAAAGSAQSMPSLEPGTVLGPLEARSLDGTDVRIDYDAPDLETVLLIFSPDCPACRGNMERWKELVAAHRDDDGKRLYYVSVTDPEATRGFVAEYGLTGPVVTAGPEALLGYEIRHIPTTILVGPGGVVRDVVVGAVPGGWLTAAGSWRHRLRSSST